MNRITTATARDGGHIYLSWSVVDELGATQFQFRVDEKPMFAGEGRFSCAGVETHFATPPDYMAGQPPSHEYCSLLNAPCWHSGTSLWASEHWVPNFSRFGTNWVWRELEHTHAQRFHAQDTGATP